MPLTQVLSDNNEIVLQTLDGEIVLRRPERDQRDQHGHWRAIVIDGPSTVVVTRRQRTDRRPG